jgi:radical SAM protein with 4Fe4S-binding SPASM domain
MSPDPGTGDGPHLPRLIFWEVTKGCNLRCLQCRASATELASPKDLPTAQCKEIIDQIAAFASPILVLSGGEPLYRSDIFQLAAHASGKGLRAALATNGTLVTKDIAQKIVDSGIQRVSISLDGSNAETHDIFRGIPGSFEAAVYGLRNLKELGVPVQINMTVARHNVAELPKVVELVRRLGADALHTFLLVPVGCGVDIADSQLVPPDEYERILHWFHDQAAEGDFELKASCAPHYSRVARQRGAAERKRGNGAAKPSIGPTEMMMPGSTGMVFKTGSESSGESAPALSGAPNYQLDSIGDAAPPAEASEGCLAGTGVCFLSFEGEVYPCGYLPAMAGDMRKQSFAEIWNSSGVLSDLRQSEKLEGKCGCCEFRNICMGCRARAFAATGNYMAEEPCCVYEPRSVTTK